MECSWTLEHLYAYLDGELSPEDAARFLSHIEICPACREALSAATEVNDLLLEHTALVEPPADFAASVMANIQRQEDSQQEHSQGEVIPMPTKRVRWGRCFSGIAVAAALLIGVVVAEPWADQQPSLDIANLPDPVITPEQPQSGIGDALPDLPVEPTAPEAPQPNQTQPTTPSIRQPQATPERPTNTNRPANQDRTVAQGNRSSGQQGATNTQQPTQPTVQPTEVEPPQPEQPTVQPTDEQPEQHTGGRGEIALPKAAYGTEGSGRFEVRLVAAHEGVNVFSPMANEKTHLVNYYIQVDGKTQLWQTDLDASQEPVFLDVYDSMEGFTEVTPLPTGANPSAISPDGSLMAALGSGDQTPGLWVTSLTDGQEPQCLTETGGGSILSWAANSGKLVFTDYLNCLYVAYPAENLVLPIATGDVSQVLWVDRGNTLLFLMCPEGGAHYGLYVAQLP